MEYCKFVVDEKAYCVWGRNMEEQSRVFLDGIDPEYFSYLAEAHANSLEADQKQHGALAIRASYVQALETLFAFLGAALQAPYCVSAWLVKYSNSDLDSLVNKIRGWNPVCSSLGYGIISWERVSQLIHTHYILEDKEKEKQTKEEFGVLWSRFASDFTNDQVKREYNSIKHGFRTKPGGFFFAMGIEDEPGVPAPPERMRLLGKSDFGSSFFIPESITDSKDSKHHIRLKRCNLNWNPEDMLYGLKLVALSLNNIVNYLKIINGVPADQVQFYRLTDSTLYEEPWKRSNNMGINSMTWTEFQITEDDIEKFSKEEILSVYKNEK